MGSPSSKLLPQSQRTVATHLMAAKRAEMLAQQTRDDFKKQEEAAGRPMVGGKFPIMGEKDPYVTANMFSVMDEVQIEAHSPLGVMPEGAYVPGSKRKVVQKGGGKVVTAPTLTGYGITEGMLREIFTAREAMGDTASASAIAEKFKLTENDVRSILQFLNPVTPVPTRDPKAFTSSRSFNPLPEQ